MIKLFGGYTKYLNVPAIVVEKHKLVYLARLHAEKEYQEREEKKWERQHREMNS